MFEKTLLKMVTMLLVIGFAGLCLADEGNLPNPIPVEKKTTPEVAIPVIKIPIGSKYITLGGTEEEFIKTFPEAKKAFDRPGYSSVLSLQIPAVKDAEDGARAFFVSGKLVRFEVNPWLANPIVNSDWLWARSTVKWLSRFKVKTTKAVKRGDNDIMEWRIAPHVVAKDMIEKCIPPPRCDLIQLFYIAWENPAAK